MVRSRKLLLIVGAVATALALASCGGRHARFNAGAPPPETRATVPAPSSAKSTSLVPTSRAPRSTGQPSTTTTAAPPPSSTTTTTNGVTMQLAPPAQPGSPAWVAARFAQAYYGVSYTWPSLGYWVVLARPYMVTSMYERSHYLVVHADNPGDKAYFDKLRAAGATHLVDVQESAVEQDAPNTADKRYVLVTYQVQALGPDEPQGGAPYGPPQVLQCTVVRSGPGAPWRVSAFGSPNAN